jgi:hypothetical protein
MTGEIDPREMVIEPVPIMMEPQKGKMKWRMRNRYTYDKGMTTHDVGVLRWYEPKTAGAPRTRWEQEADIMGLFILWKTDCRNQDRADDQLNSDCNRTLALIGQCESGLAKSTRKAGTESFAGRFP